MNIVKTIIFLFALANAEIYCMKSIEELEGKQTHNINSLINFINLPTSIQKQIVHQYLNETFKNEIISKLKGHTGLVTCFLYFDKDFSNRKILVSGARDNSIKIWDIEASECLATLTEHTTRIEQLLDLGLNDKGERIIASQEQGQRIEHGVLAGLANNSIIKVWNLTTYKCLFTCDKHGIQIPYSNFQWNALSKSGKYFAPLSYEIAGPHGNPILKTTLQNKWSRGFFQELYQNVRAETTWDDSNNINIIRETKPLNILRKYFYVKHPLVLLICLLENHLTEEQIIKIKAQFKDDDSKISQDIFFKWIESIHSEIRKIVKAKFQ